MILIFSLIGTCFGSFIHLTISRFNLKKQTLFFLTEISLNRSYCFSCQNKLLAWQLIPIFSWLILKGRCNHCSEKIPYHTLICEFTFLLLSLFIAIFIGVSIKSFILLLLGGYFFVLAIIDIKYYLLPDVLTFPLLGFGFISRYLGISQLSANEIFIGIILAYLLLAIPAYLYFLVKKQVGLGGGDIKLLSVLGSSVPYYQLPILLVIASITGCLFIIIYRCLCKQWLAAIPFGPFLLFSSYLLILNHNTFY